MLYAKHKYLIMTGILYLPSLILLGVLSFFLQEYHGYYNMMLRDIDESGSGVQDEACDEFTLAIQRITSVPFFNISTFYLCSWFLLLLQVNYHQKSVIYNRNLRQATIDLPDNSVYNYQKRLHTYITTTKEKWISAIGT
tara:strand:- start:2153 stop:2569 length:417 start_codon:yes stop_codon:yes gene_type:complete